MAEDNGPCSLIVGGSTFSVSRQTEVSKGKVSDLHNTEYCPLVPVGVDTAQESCHLNRRHREAPVAESQEAGMHVVQTLIFQLLEEARPVGTSHSARFHRKGSLW